MQRKRAELIPIGEVVSGLDDVSSIRDDSPQARHHFTQADQVNQLVAASEATPDLGFIARMMALCSLPRTNPGNRHQYKRVNGPFTLYMNAVGDCYDNALCESFFASLECELIDRHSFRSKLQARLAVFDYIEGFYNPHRRHSSLDYLSPINYESRHSDVA